MDQNYGYEPTQAVPTQPVAEAVSYQQAVQAEPAQPVAQATPLPLPKQRWYTGLGKLIAAIVGTGVILIAPAFLYDIPYYMGLDWEENLVYELIGAIIAIVVILILGGRKLFTYSDDDRKIAWKAIWWSIAISAVMMVLSIWDTVSEGIEIVPDWPINLAYAFFLCLGIGFFEEGMVRGALLGGLMAKFGRTKAGVWFAVILSSLIFGAMHIDFSSDIDPSNWLTIAQAALKILQTGMYGFVLAAVVVRTRSIFWPALLHGLDDFLLFVPDVVLLGDTVETEYVSTGDDAMVSVIFYIIICVLYIPLVVKGVKLLLGIDNPDRGALMGRWEKKRAAQLAASGVEKEGVVLASMAPATAVSYGVAPAPQGYVAQQYQQPAQTPAPQGYVAPQPQVPQGYVAPQPQAQQYQQPVAQYQQPVAQYQQPVAQYQQPVAQQVQQYPMQYPQQGIPTEGEIPSSGQTPPPSSW